MKLITGALMINDMTKPILFCTLIAFIFTSCKQEITAEKGIDASIPVTLTTIDTTAISSSIDLNATATYLVKNVIKANATGYLNSVNVASNDFVSKGKELFSIKTRESKVLGNTINKIDPTLNFGGAIKVRANTNGYITAVNVQQGDYVQDGDALATINDSNSFAIVLSLPFELKKQVAIGKQLQVLLPDSTSVQARVQIVKVRITTASNSKSISLPKAAVLSDETETDFWIMKMINATTAVKIPIKKGIETNDRVEVLSPILNREDKILITGNYGVADTIKVKVSKK